MAWERFELVDWRNFMDLIDVSYTAPMSRLHGLLPRTTGCQLAIGGFPDAPCQA